MTNSYLTLFCIVDGNSVSNAFEVEVESAKTVSALRKLIRAEKPNDFSDVDADQLTLWRASIPVVPPNRHKLIVLNEIESATELYPTEDLSDVFQETPPKKTIHIIVQRPPQAPKRDRDDDEGPSSKRKRPETYTLMDAIEAAGLTEKAVVDGESDLSPLPSD
ncbi:hypothetical protein BG000_003878 [Podila horticola]|nr:hypothetical protein BG000_003878 [Podila horticola]